MLLSAGKGGKGEDERERERMDEAPPSLPPSLARSAQEFDLTAAAGLGIPGRGSEGEGFYDDGTWGTELCGFLYCSLMKKKERLRGEFQSSGEY